ncbi:putative peroxisomal multifunctional beta-oxidation protein AoFox2 [Talaromyces proteolyticus]|uniref:Peroxisomal multifunctional beta-oxidation protein AoFox2 n=1 Tax=Talaromyces proteolyticus TaxID=1131652 RepID=A0AAD4KU19_9EURO|nr:putative peroxisomal multifunctional beta-oxidation protein AoFox2 [Talaromyces proteolyticus]KAH8700872.1 putative peroxisomal multifunctional beta-oxidation protein AoFox2 [Talaromyces proteolyticus]
MSSFNFKDQTVIITGISHGFGTAYATEFARRGANLVVNDTSKEAVDTLVEELHRLGANAIPNYDDIGEGDKIVDTAVSNFGTVHVLVSNMGTIGHKNFALLGNEEWLSMLRVDLKGSYKCAKAVWPHFRKQRYGRILNTASISDSSSQTLNYTALFAQLGFTETLAKEGMKYNILVNVLSPVSATIFEPRWVVPFTMVLTHRWNNETGCLFEVGNGSVQKLRWERTKGALLKPDSTLTPEAILNRWKDVINFTNPDYPNGSVDLQSTLERTQKLMPSVGGDRIEFKGKVVLVTGASSGLGRSYALHLATRGAYVVVNDRADPTPVVDQIRRSGGTAVGVMASVEDGNVIVQAAINSFGRIDILINNAGFVRDKSFVNMTDDLWDSIIAVHLNGTYQMTKAIWPYFVRQKYGRIINTTSTSGIYGNFGQANYAAAKLGIVGLSNALAREGAEFNIHVNTIAPGASTPALAAALAGSSNDYKPEYVASFVSLIASNNMPEPRSNGLFEVTCGWHAQTRLQRSQGYDFSCDFRFCGDAELTAEAVTKAWKMAVSFETTGSKDPGDSQALHSDEKTRLMILQNIDRGKKMRGKGTEFIYGIKDTIIYNLSVGAKRRDLSLIYERSGSLHPLPTFGVIPFFNTALPFDISDIVPGFTPHKFLHGEHYLEILKHPLPASGKFITYPKLVDVLDKGTAAIVVIGYTTVDTRTGDKVLYNRTSLFVRNVGSFGNRSLASANDKRPGDSPLHPPERDPDANGTEITSQEQAAWYRLTGDKNPMHIDPAVSRRGGFDIPILHGLCTFGISGRHIYQCYGPFNKISARFTGTVLPGQTLRTEMWKEKGSNVIIWQTRVMETGKLCIQRATAELLVEDHSSIYKL